MSQEKTQEKRVRQTYRCSFCDKTQDQVERLIAGTRGVHICDECIELCNQIHSRRTKAAEAGRVIRKCLPCLYYDCF